MRSVTLPGSNSAKKTLRSASTIGELDSGRPPSMLLALRPSSRSAAGRVSLPSCPSRLEQAGTLLARCAQTTPADRGSTTPSRNRSSDTLASRRFSRPRESRDAPCAPLRPCRGGSAPSGETRAASWSPARETPQLGLRGDESERRPAAGSHGPLEPRPCLGRIAAYEKPVADAVAQRGDLNIAGVCGCEDRIRDHLTPIETEALRVGVSGVGHIGVSVQERLG